MINSHRTTETASSEDEALERVLAVGPGGAFLLSGVTTAIVLGLWLAFYFFVFIPHANP
jgi:hypothetical protein